MTSVGRYCDRIRVGPKSVCFYLTDADVELTSIPHDLDFKRLRGILSKIRTKSHSKESLRLLFIIKLTMKYVIFYLD